MKLEIGMYCYYKNHRKSGIGKILKIEKNNNCLVDYNTHIGLVSCGNLVASHNIISLIEIGDYVNSCKVIKVNLEPPLKYVKCINDNCFKEKEIETILTHEQFENNCFRIGE